MISFGSAPVEAMGGQIVIVEAPSAILTSGQSYALSWIDGSGVGVQLTQGVASTRTKLALQAPTLAAGGYRVDIGLGIATGRFTVDLAEALAVANPEAYVATFRTDFEAATVTRRSNANNEADPAVRAALLADLDEIDRRYTQLTTLTQGATAQELAELASFLQTHEAQWAAGQNDFVSEEERIRSAKSRMVAGGGLMAFGSAALVFGLNPAFIATFPIAAAAATVLGLTSLYVGGTVFASGFDMGVRPDSGLQLSDSLQVPLTDGGSALSLATGVGLPLHGSAMFASLSAGDRQSPSAALRDIFTPVDAAYGVFEQMPVEALSLVQSRPRQVPSQPQVAREAVDVQQISLDFQTNPQVTLTVAYGVLTAEGAVSATTIATFRYSAGELGSLTTAVTVQLVDIGPNMVPIAAGTFQMGSGAYTSTPGYEFTTNELPVHGVTITQPFWMGKYEVTQSAYQAVMGSNPSYFQGANRPVEHVTWFNAVAYCDALSVQEAAAGRLPSGYEYRLPTEAEWEYCCRAGTSTEWNVGSSLSCAQANHYSNGFCVPNPGTGGQTSAVGAYAANAWGLHDMHGNVSEWCLDSWDGNPNYPSGAVSDPFVSSGPHRVARGGSWGYSGGSIGCRSASRFRWIFPEVTNYLIGFRVVCAPVR